MKVLVCGATGCVGRAVTRALQSRGHQVIEGARGVADGPRTLAIDYMEARTPQAWADTLRLRDVECIVNAVGILMPSAGQSHDRVHARGPAELFAGAALAGVRRVVQVSALGVGPEPEALAVPYLCSKLQAEEALASLPLDGVVLRPSVVYGPGSRSAALFATLASLPVIGLPGGGQQRLQPIQVYELAEIVARLLERPGPVRGVLEVGGGQILSYRDMLSRYREALGLGKALWLPVPAGLVRLGAWLAEGLPQQVFCRTTMTLLEHGSVPRVNAAAAVLGRPASSLAQGLAVTPPQPWIDLSVRLSPPVSLALRAALAFMWIYTAGISAALQQASGVLALLARCGFEGPAGLAALGVSCTLNAALGVLILLRPGPWTYAAQLGAIAAYSTTAALNMPELVLDHCGPLVKNVPVAMAVLVLWLDTAPAALRSRPTEDRLHGSRFAKGPGGAVAS